MSWLDFLFGMGMGALALCFIVWLILGVWLVYEGLDGRIKKLEDAAHDEEGAR